MTLSLEGSPTKAKEVLSPYEVRLALLDTNPVLQCLALSNIALNNHFLIGGRQC